MKLKQMINKRIGFYKREIVRLYILLNMNNQEIIIKTINEHEAVIKELEFIQREKNKKYVTLIDCV